jgi:hypothetical protein
VNNSSLQAKLGKYVLEITFVRRHPKAGWSDVRGLFGTTNYALLNSDFGLQVLRFSPPKGVGMGYNYKQYNLCVVWDIFRQEYRVFGAEAISVRQIWDVSTEEGTETFKEYFYQYIINMSNDDKLKFMGYRNDEVAVHQPNVSPQTKKGVISRIGDKFKPFVNRIKNFFKKK